MRYNTSVMKRQMYYFFKKIGDFTSKSIKQSGEFFGEFGRFIRYESRKLIKKNPNLPKIIFVGVCVLVVVLVPVIIIASSAVPVSAEPEQTPEPIMKIEVVDPTPTPVVYKLISSGYEGPEVVLLQERLMELDYMDQDAPTEKFGPITTEALKTFQRQNALTVDGNATPKTQTVLHSSDAQHYFAQEGDEGKDIENIQNELYRLGFLSTKGTGTFGEKTATAVIAFQRKNEIPITGTVDAKTKTLLFSEEAKGQVITVGSPQSDTVKKSQELLIKWGYLPKTAVADGKYGSATYSAVKLFQDRNDLTADGALGPTTMDALRSNKEYNTISIGMNGTDVAKVQQQLKKLKYPFGKADGYYGEATAKAVKQFQKINGLSQDGKVGEKTMERLMADKAKACPDIPPVVTTPKPSKTPKPSSGGGGNVNIPLPDEAMAAAMVKVAQSKIGSPYVRGGKGPNVFDCSGFVYWVINQVGIKQGFWDAGVWGKNTKYPKIESRSDCKAGDILSFKGHVGICVGPNMMIDASSSNGKVVYRNFTEKYWVVNWKYGFRII